jgi:hypothetical protein
VPLTIRKGHGPLRRTTDPDGGYRCGGAISRQAPAGPFESFSVCRPSRSSRHGRPISKPCNFGEALFSLSSSFIAYFKSLPSADEVQKNGLTGLKSSVSQARRKPPPP